MFYQQDVAHCPLGLSSDSSFRVRLMLGLEGLGRAREKGSEPTTCDFASQFGSHCGESARSCHFRFDCRKLAQAMLIGRNVQEYSNAG